MADQKLFGILPKDIFKPLSGPNALLYAGLLEYLFDEVYMSYKGDLPRKKELLEEIRSYLERWNENALKIADVDDDLSQLTVGERPSAVYSRLKECGWLIEHRHGHIYITDILSDARQVLQAIIDVARNKGVTFTGSLISVIGALDSAIESPDTKAEAIRNAKYFSQDLLWHFKYLLSKQRESEAEMFRSPDTKVVFEAFFDGYVGEQISRDMKNIASKHNPAQFKADIIEKIQHILFDDDLIEALSEAYLREKIAPDLASAEEMIRNDLIYVEQVFSNIQTLTSAFMDGINRVTGRIKRRTKFMNRTGMISTERMIEAMRSLNQLPEGVDIPNGSKLNGEELPLCQDYLADLFPSPRQKAQMTIAQRHKKDPLEEIYYRAQLIFSRRINAGIEQMGTYVEALLDGADEIPSSAISPQTDDEFIVFQRLRDIPFIHSRYFADIYGVRLTGTTEENKYLRYPGFVLFRKTTSQTAGKEVA